MQINDDTRTETLHGKHGRDAGKAFTVVEIAPLACAGYVLRLNSALQITSYETLLADWKAAADEGEPPIDLIMGALRSSDPAAVHALITELLTYVLISPDPQHPGVNRPLMATDIKEMKTLGEVLAAILKLNFSGI